MARSSETMTVEATSLDALRRQLAPALADAAVFDGWSDEAVAAAADQHGVDPAVAAFAFSGGPMAMIAAWIAACDAAMAAEWPAERLAQLKIRERIRTLVQFRLDYVTPQQEALVRALALMAMPQNVAQAAKLGWHSADLMWRLAGDTATDYNHYTKRTILSGIYAATLAVLFMLGLLPAMQGAFSLALQDSIEQRLASDVTTLISAARVDNNRLLMPAQLPDERFNLTDSRLLGYIYDREGHLVWRSRATQEENINYKPRYDGRGNEFARIREANGQEFFVYDVEVRLLGG